jgi:hypothetical protein
LIIEGTVIDMNKTVVLKLDQAQRQSTRAA